MKLGRDVAAVVTGGASGLGAATATALSEKGVKVGVLDINEAAGAALAERIGAKFAKCDVTSEASVDAALASVRAAHGQERILVNCAGIAIGQRIVRRMKDTGAVEPHDLGSFRKVIEINLIGTFLMISKCAAGMVTLPALSPDGERGVIINTASVAAEDGQIGQVAYAASKGGIVGLTLPAARDLSPVGVRVCTIAPGIMDTPLLGLLPEDQRAALGAGVPFPKRLGTPDDFASLVQQIAENGYLNGETIRLDGALRMPPK